MYIHKHGMVNICIKHDSHICEESTLDIDDERKIHVYISFCSQESCERAKGGWRSLITVLYETMSVDSNSW